MRRHRAMAICAILAGQAAIALSGEMPERLTPEEIGALPLSGNGAGTSGVTTMRTSVLSGDPAKPGLYTIQIVIPPNTTIRAHHHRDDRVATVVSGVWFIGYGAQRDAKQLKQLPAGSFYTEPAGEPHFAGTGGAPAIVHITGYGPTDTAYVDDADDPAKATQ